MVGICELQCKLMLPWLQFELPLRLGFSKVLMRGVERDGLAWVHKCFGSVDDEYLQHAFAAIDGSHRSPAHQMDGGWKRAESRNTNTIARGGRAPPAGAFTDVLIPFARRQSCDVLAT